VNRAREARRPGGDSRMDRRGGRTRWWAGSLGLLTLLAGGLTSPPAWADDPTLQVRVDRNEVAEGDAITLTVTLEGFSRQAGDPEIARIDGFEIYSRGSSTNVSLINGKLSSSTSLSYQLVAQRAGMYTLPPVKVQDKGRVYQSEPITLKVLPAGGATGAAPRGGGTAAPGGGRSPGSAQRPEQADGRSLYAVLEADKSDVYLDEQFVLRFRLYQRSDVTVYELSDFAPPATEGFWREDLGQQAEQRLRVGGDLFIVREVAWVLFPTKVGDLVIGPGSVVAQVPDRTRRGFFTSMFDRRPVEVATKSLRVHVKPLPAAGRPADFTGSVGQYEISAAFDPPQGRQGEAVALTVRVRGAGHIQTIGAPDWPAWEGLRVFDSGEAVSVDKGAGRVEGEKTFTQVLVPTRTGAIALEPISFGYFDPARERYVTLATPALTLDVQPAAAGAPGAVGATDVVAVGSDILYIRQDLAAGLRPLGGQGASGVWVVHLLPLAAAGGAFWLHRRRATLARDPSFARRAQALRRAQERLKTLEPTAPPAQVAAGLAEALEGFLGDWLDAEVRGMRRAELEGELRAAGAPGAMVDEALGHLAWADDVRFGAGGRGDVSERLAAAGRLVREFDGAMRRVTVGVGS
jgi:hypothetical protein